MEREHKITFIYVVLCISLVVSYFYVDITPDRDEDIHIEASIEFLEVGGVSDEPLRQISSSFDINCEESNFQETDKRGISNFDLYVNEGTELQFCLEELETDKIEIEDLEKIDRVNFNEKYYVKIRSINVREIK